VNVGKVQDRGEITGLRMYEFDEYRRLIVIREAKKGNYDEKGFWNLQDVLETRVKEVGANHPLDVKYNATTIKLPLQRLHSEVTPEILSILLINPERMSIMSLNRFITHLKENKQESQNYEITFWKKIIYPFTILVMLCLALPFGYIHARSGGISIKVFGGIMLGMSFQLFNTLFSHLGLLGAWAPPLTATIPPLIYLTLGLIALFWVSRR
jgi:lipopolysaccharide export system permease protein